MMFPSFFILFIKKTIVPVRQTIFKKTNGIKRSDTLYSIVSTAITRGIESVVVQVEADVSPGMPVFEMVGFLGAEVKEAKERVRTALKNAGYLLPAKRITINLSPAGLRKTGSGFDLPIATAVMAALGIINGNRTKNVLIIGEIGLNGSVQPVNGILPIVSGAAQAGFTACMIPEKNKSEAQLVTDVSIISVKNIAQVIAYFTTGAYEKQEIKKKNVTAQKTVLDFSELNGQPFLRRACEVAVCGMHNLLMVGPPGAGKTMAAKRIPSILPPLDEEEQMELAKIYSVCGRFDEKESWLFTRPFRSPHHTVTPQGLAGGGGIPKPGEISLAHHGVLFLDELTEFKKETLEVLRQPMEEKSVHLVRMAGTYHYPANFMLVAAMNPCNCGNYPDMQKCRCTRGEINHYLNRISQPLLDRIDICVEVPRLSYEEISEHAANESSKQIRERVMRTQEIQRERYYGSGIRFNSQIPAESLEEYLKLDRKKKAYLKQIYTKLNLSARAYHKILKVARTIADLEQSKDVQMQHLNEAVCYRSLDKKFWETTI